MDNTVMSYIKTYPVSITLYPEDVEIAHKMVDQFCHMSRNQSLEINPEDFQFVLIADTHGPIIKFLYRSDACLIEEQELLHRFEMMLEMTELGMITCPLYVEMVLVDPGEEHRGSFTYTFKLINPDGSPYSVPEFKIGSPTLVCINNSHLVSE